ncbi:hypothetical protein BDL97_09G092600 [Sphagnum fallax]|nr:hypothetical protein BDL97_09G092600 [Sphagnum fallax]
MEERIRKQHPHHHHVWMVSSMLAMVICLSAGLYGLMGVVLQDGWFHYCPKPSVFLQQLAANTRSEFQEAVQYHQHRSILPNRVSSRGPEGEAEEEEESCMGRYVHVYDLPPFFNQKLVDDCLSADPPWLYTHCEDLTNRGLGERINNTIFSDSKKNNDSDLYNNVLALPGLQDAWYKTNQFTLELIYHERFKHYDCLTDDPDKAIFTYIPFYSALDLTPKLFGDGVSSNAAARDRACQRLIGWLQASRHWERTGGKNHVLLLGRIVWDYTRSEFDDHGWGNPLLSFPEMENVTKLSIEISPTREDQGSGIPYPTAFHPSSDAQIASWQTRISSSKRETLVVFAGVPRSDNKRVTGSSIRSELMKQCSNYSQPPHNNNNNNNNNNMCSLLSCSVIDCERNPQHLMEAFLNAVFCLQPAGDSATRKGVFDCLIAGGIPVFFDPETAYMQYHWHLPQNGSSYSVFFPREAVVNGSVDVIQELQRIPLSAIASMQHTINSFLPNLLYSKPGSNLTTPDAFDISVQNLLHRFRQN